MSALQLVPVDGDDADLRIALSMAGLPTDDLGDAGRCFFRGVSRDGRTVGFSGLEFCGDDVLLRSVVVLPDFREKAFGRALVEQTLAEAGDAGVYLATTGAASFFERFGFQTVARTKLPAAILATRQLSAICPASATVMKRIRAPASSASNDHGAGATQYQGKSSRCPCSNDT